MLTAHSDQHFNFDPTFSEVLSVGLDSLILKHSVLDAKAIDSVGGHFLSAKDVKSKPNRQTRTNNIKAVLIAFATILLIPIATLFILHIPLVQRGIIRQVANTVEKLADVQIAMETCRLSPLNRVHIDSLRVRSSSKDFILSEKVQLTFYLGLKWPYFFPAVVLFDEPTVYLEKDEKGRWRIPRKDTATLNRGSFHDPSTRWVDFPWPEVRIKSGRVFAFQQGEMILSLQNLNGTIPYRIVTGKGGPTLIVDLGKWY